MPITTGTYREYVGQYLQWVGIQWTQNTAITRAKHIKEFLEWLPKEDTHFTTTLLNKYFDHICKQGYAENTILTKIKSVKTSLKHISHMRHCQAKIPEWKPKIPVSILIKPPRVKRTWTIEDVNKVIHWCKTTKSKLAPCWECAVRVAWETGLRFGDTVTLMDDQVDWDQKVITAIPIKTQRRGVRVTIPVSDELVQFLHQWKGTKFYQHEYFMWPIASYVLAKQTHQALSWCNHVRKAAGVAHLHWHELRNTFVTRWLEAGTPIPTVASMTGHTFEMLQRYANVRIENKRRWRTVVEQADKEEQEQKEKIMKLVIV